MKKGNKVIAVTLSMVLAVTGIAAGSTSESAAKTKIALNKTKVTLTVGQSVTLRLKGIGKKVKWSSGNKKVATVNSKGKVKARKAGKAKITAKAGKKKYSCKVTVKKKTTVIPEATSAPTQTSPVVHVLATNTPSVTSSPIGTRVPSVTSSPLESTKPSQTKTPDVTQKPSGTVTTDAPFETESPVQTDIPARTDVPAQTDTPDEPLETSLPTWSEEPKYFTVSPVTPGAINGDNEALARNVETSLLKLPNGQIVLKMINRNDETLNYCKAVMSLMNDQGEVIETDMYTASFLTKDEVTYYPSLLFTDKTEEADISKSETQIIVDQSYWESQKDEVDVKPLSHFTLTSQKRVENGETNVYYEVQNGDTQAISVIVTILYKDEEGNLVDVFYDYYNMKPGQSCKNYFCAPKYKYKSADHEMEERIPYSSYEIYINGNTWIAW